MRRFLALPGVLSALALAPPAGATDRHFAFTYETGVLAEGEAEFEPWTTFRLGRDRYYSRIDLRLEFEVGLIKNLQSALYWNLTRVSQDVVNPVSGQFVRASAFSLTSISSEWKYKLSDPLADPIGSALYLEGTYGPDLAEIEAKVLIDKQMGGLLLAANFVGEEEWEYQAGEAVSIQELALDLAGGYFLGPTFVLGIEALSATRIERGDLVASAVYAGPSLAHAAGRYWVALAILPQLFAPKSARGSHDLAHNEYVRARILLGLHL